MMFFKIEPWVKFFCISIIIMKLDRHRGQCWTRRHRGQYYAPRHCEHCYVSPSLQTMLDVPSSRTILCPSSLRARSAWQSILEGLLRYARNDEKLLKQSHQIVYCLTTSDYLYAAILADENFGRAWTAVVG